jgi:hypothetical protein
MRARCRQIYYCCKVCQAAHWKAEDISKRALHQRRLADAQCSRVSLCQRRLFETPVDTGRLAALRCSMCVCSSAPRDTSVIMNRVRYCAVMCCFWMTGHSAEFMTSFMGNICRVQSECLAVGVRDFEMYARSIDANSHYCSFARKE